MPLAFTVRIAALGGQRAGFIAKRTDVLQELERVKGTAPGR